jgi:hypothetical protein
MKGIAQTMLDQTLQNYLNGSQNQMNNIQQYAQSINPMQAYNASYGQAMTQGGNFGPSTAEKYGQAVNQGLKSYKESKKDILTAQEAEQTMQEKMVNTLMLVEQYKSGKANKERELDLKEKHLQNESQYQKGMLGVHQGELDVKRGQLDVNRGELDVKNRAATMKESMLPPQIQKKIDAFNKKTKEASLASRILEKAKSNPNLSQGEHQTINKQLPPSFRYAGDPSNVVSEWMGKKYDYAKPLLLAHRHSIEIEEAGKEANKMLKSGIPIQEVIDFIDQFDLGGIEDTPPQQEGA